MRRHIKRYFDIDEPTSDTPKSKQQGPLDYGKGVYAHRLAADVRAVVGGTPPRRN